MEVKLIVREVGAPPAAKPLLEDIWRTSVISVGSSPQATLRLTGLGIAAEHVIIFEENGHIIFVNHGDGTRLNGLPVRIGDRRPLTFGDRIHIGNYVITVLDGNSPAARLDDPRATSLLQAATRELFTSGLKFDLDSLLPAAFRPSSPRKSLEIPENASFAQILEALVAPEDSFRFVIEGGLPAERLPAAAGRGCRSPAGMGGFGPAHHDQPAGTGDVLRTCPQDRRAGCVASGSTRPSPDGQ
jgi:hypothetical protein